MISCVAAQAFGDRDDPLDQRFAARPRGRTPRQAPVTRAVSSAARIVAGVGPAAVDRRPADPRAPGDLGQRHPLDAVGGRRSWPRRRGCGRRYRSNALLIDSICNTVTHVDECRAAAADEVERLGRPGRGQAAVGRNSRRCSSRRSGWRIRRWPDPKSTRSGCGRRRCRPPIETRWRRSSEPSTSRRRPGAAAACGRQVDARPAAAQGHRTGCA